MKNRESNNFIETKFNDTISKIMIVKSSNSNNLIKYASSSCRSSPTGAKKFKTLERTR